jgi:hypothetical protein
MFRSLVHPLLRHSRCFPRILHNAVSEAIGPKASKLYLQPRLNRTAIRTICSRPHCWCQELRKCTAEKAEKLRALGAEGTFTKYDPLDWKHVNRMEDWYAKGPPPLSEYRLSFGKHKGKRLQEVPDVYFAKYLIPRENEIHNVFEHPDPLVYEALQDHLKRNPDLKNQAGSKKTVVREGGVVESVRPRGRPRKTPSESPTPSTKRPRGRPRKTTSESVTR